jgi:hypothetical protein
VAVELTLTPVLHTVGKYCTCSKASGCQYNENSGSWMKDDLWQPTKYLDSKNTYAPPDSMKRRGSVVDPKLFVYGYLRFRIHNTGERNKTTFRIINSFFAYTFYIQYLHQRGNLPRTKPISPEFPRERVYSTVHLN